jgi:hypothetical protein
MESYPRFRKEDEKAIRIEAKVFRLGVSHRDQWQQSGLVDLAQAYGLSYDDSQTTWLGDAVCITHRCAERRRQGV